MGTKGGEERGNTGTQASWQTQVLGKVSTLLSFIPPLLCYHLLLHCQEHVRTHEPLESFSHDIVRLVV